jgi:hypothetical protein
MKNIISKSEILLKSLIIYYENNNKINIILPILLGKSKLSISFFNNFITQYAKNNNVIIKKNLKKKLSYELINDNDNSDNDINDNNDKMLNIYNDYKLQLKSYKKIFFDCFSRNKRIKFYIDNDKEKYLITTIGQLNFFKWIIDNNIIDYIMLNYNIIN